ncbi:transposase [Kitasatospora sp. NPDC004669]|uniref:transposase n=1 Tax=Kitasatospora sp. NPDC004669 TaxID=3154555 RepID=UPI0033B5C046
MAEVRKDLETFTAEMFEAFAHRDQQRWGRVYVRGLLMDGGRKSVEPMAAWPARPSATGRPRRAR